MSSVTFPNGQTLVSSALTPDALLQRLQTLTANILGMNPTTSRDAAYASVRVEWPQEGQPGFDIDDDITFLRATENDDPYSRIRDIRNATNDLQSIRQTITYTRVWSVLWTVYGPNSYDHARLIVDGMFLDWAHDALATNNLYLLTEVARPTYAPELFQGQWWKRTDVTMRLNELVTATVNAPSIASSEVLLYNGSGLVADLNNS